MENQNKHKIKYIIFGASGDLAKRYLLPALEKIDAKINIDVIKISRGDYDNLKNLIPGSGDKSEKIFHLAIPPEGVPEAVELISKNFAGDNRDNRDNIKILLEKPFGKDLKSAQLLIEHIDRYFSEEQIYRVDHYLAKKSFQNVLKGDLNRENIKSINIIASEKIGIEGRANFYEQVGALKDFVQSHLLEMASVVLSGSLDQKKRHLALQNLAVVCDIAKHECVKRAQYEGYREEVNNTGSMTETFVSVNLLSDNIPINLTTGKALSEKLTQVEINMKSGGRQVFDIEHETDAYERVIRAAIAGECAMFVSSGEVLDSWRILEDIQNSWKTHEGKIEIYKKGSTIEEVMK